MIDIKDPKDCCGCTACASVCPHHAISMEADALGFLYPVVDTEKCVGCGLCDKICQFGDYYDKSLNLKQPVAFAARHHDNGEVMKSRSGATFVAISDRVLSLGGVVYGAGYKDHFRVAHKRATTKGERDEFRGSKYVQSDLTGIFRQVRDDLRSGLTVMFTGTPCQTAGLNAFVGKQLRERLYLVDIVCHGVPGPFVWRDYLAWIEKKYGAEVSHVNFRDKEQYGWTAHQETFMLAGRKEKLAFRHRFYQDIYLRHSCGVCPFTNLHRPSDLTIADYWGWQRTSPTINADDKGCSLVLCNTEKGRSLFSSVKGEMMVIEADLANVTQTHLTRPMTPHPKRLLFEQKYAKEGFVRTMSAFGLIGWRFYARDILQRIARRLHITLKT